MLRRILPLALIVCSLLAVAPASGDPWKDESGHGKHWKEWKGEKEDRGETPWWGRGKGYWDGHFKHRKFKHRDWEPPVYGRPQHFGPSPPYFYDAPSPRLEFYYEDSWPHEELPPPLPHGWH